MLDTSLCIPLDAAHSFGSEPNLDASIALLQLRMAKAPINEAHLTEAFSVLTKQLSALAEPTGKVSLLYRHLALTESFTRWLFAQAQQATKASEVEKLTKAACMAQNAASRLCAIVSVLENQPQRPDRLKLPDRSNSTCEEVA